MSRAKGRTGWDVQITGNGIPAEIVTEGYPFSQIYFPVSVMSLPPIWQGATVNTATYQNYAVGANNIFATDVISCSSAGTNSATWLYALKNSPLVGSQNNPNPLTVKMRIYCFQDTTPTTGAGDTVQFTGAVYNQAYTLNGLAAWNDVGGGLVQLEDQLGVLVYELDLNVLTPPSFPANLMLQCGFSRTGGAFAGDVYVLGVELAFANDFSYVAF
jgi:hypothetical protein